MSEEKEKFENFKTVFLKSEQLLADALNGQLDIKKFVSVALSHVQSNPDLLNQNRETLYKAIHDAASEGLLLDSRESALVPYKGKVKFSAMIGGVVKKLTLAGISVNPQVVYKDDIFEYFTDENGQHIHHKVDPFKNRGEMIGVYVIATMGIIKHIEIMSKEEVESVRAKSAFPKSLMWSEFYDEGAKKSVVRRAYKWLPKNDVIDAFFKRDEEDAWDFTQGAEEIKPARTTSRVESIINQSDKPEVEEVKPVVTEQKSAPVENKKTSLETKSVEGTIYGMKIKIENGKNRFVCKIGEFIYGTNDEAMYMNEIVPAEKNKLLIRISFTERETSDMIFRDINMIERVTPEEYFKDKTSDDKPKLKERPL